MPRQRYVVPSVETAMQQFKKEVMVREGFASPAHSPENVKYPVAQKLGIPLQKGYNGQMTTEQAGKIGGKIGGTMVREMVRIAQQQMAGQNPPNP